MGPRRGEAPQVPGVREGLQPELQPHHPQPQTHRLQALRLRPVRQRLPAEGGLAEAQRDATRTEVRIEAQIAHLNRTEHLYVRASVPGSPGR